MLAHVRTRLIARNTRWVRQAHAAGPHHEDARWPGWNLVIGIEVHAQIKSLRKLFSEAPSADLADSDNRNITPFDAAFPGTLPRLNPIAVELGVRAALALNAEVQHRSAFDRKHYFYADLPSGYQITQQYAPLARNGRVQLQKDGISVRIKQIQLEQDTGKSVFLPRQRLTTVDLNRAGMGLMEIVSEPDMRSPEQAGHYVKTLQALLRAVGSSDGNMEKGSLRCDVNVSVNRPGEPPGTRCEIKNLNSVKFMQVAITHEAFRQIALLERGLPVEQETRGFNEEKAETYSLRSKEDAPDYRYMPDPNIPPLLIDAAYVDHIRQQMPALPESARAQLLQLGLTERDVEVLMDIDAGRDVLHDGHLGHGGATAYFEEISRGRDPKVIVNWMLHELLGQLAYRKVTFRENPVAASQMGELIDLVESGKVTGTSGKLILRHILDTRTSEPPSMIAEEERLFAVDAESPSLKAWCEEAITRMPKEAAAVRQGKVNVVNKIMGHVMNLSRGTAKAEDVRATLLKILQ